MSVLEFLLLEANLPDAEMVQTTLRAGGIDCELLRVDTRSDFVAALETDKFDLVLSDYALSDFEGIDVLATARSLCPETPLIFVAGSVGEELAIKAIKQGATDYVLKHRLEQLVPAVQRALRETQERRKRQQAERERDRFLVVGSDLQVITGINGYFQWVSPTFERTLGWTVEEMISRPWTDFVHSDDISESVEETDSLFSGNETFAFENRYRHKDGSYRWFLWRAQPHPEEQVIYGVAVDITQAKRDEADRKQTAQALRDSEERSQNVLESIAEAFFALDEDWRFTYLNQSAEALLDRPPGDLIGKNFWQEYPGVTGNEFETIYRGAMGDRVAGSLTEFYPDHDRWYEVRTYPAANGIAVYFRNVTDLKQAEAALREGENRLRLALEATELGTWDFNPLTGTLQWDDQCKAMFGLPSESEINYEVFLAGLHPEDRDRTHQVVLSSLSPESGGEYDIEYRTVGIEDHVERWIAAKGKAFFNPSGIAERFIGTVLNITEKKRAEVEREQLLHREQTAREEAERANRIKDEFLAVLSHELRTPMNPILGWAKLLQQGNLNAAKTIKALATIERNAQLQVQLIDDLLDISRILSGKMSLSALPVDLSTVISAALETVRLAAEAKSIQIRTAISPILGEIIGDEGRLQQVMWNLLSNAVKFTPQSGQVTIALSQVEHHAQIQVIDTGKGVRDDFLPYVFEHFRQEDGATTRKFGGLGLGLAIVRQIVEMHGGTVTVDSPGEGLGTTFTVQLPLAARLTKAPLINLSPASESDLSGVHVLVVDDTPDSREFMAFALEQANAMVTTCASAAEALQAIARSLPNIMVSDVGMPEMDGYMLMRQIRALPLEQGGQLPAIALTAYAGELDRQQALRAGFQQHLTKPIKPDELVRAVATLIRMIVPAQS